MANDSEHDLSQQTISKKNYRNESLFLSLVKVIFVAIGIAVIGSLFCTIMLFVIFSLREFGILIMLCLLPFATYFTFHSTKKYFSEKPSCFRGAIAWGGRYLVVGAILGLVLKLLIGGSISDVPLSIYYGSIIGTICGSLGGAFQGWIQTIRKPAFSDNRRTL